MVTNDSVPASDVDVLIIGAGPAGLMMALWMARLGIKARIVDKRTAKVFSGQADGFQSRTLEILDSFGIGERVWKEANHMIEVCIWNPDSNGQIRRDSRIEDVLPGLSRFTQVVLHQGRMEQFFLDAIRDSYPASKNETRPSSSPIRVERCTIPTSLVLDEDAVDSDDTYPITVKLRHLSEEEATPARKLSNLSDGMFRSNLAGDDTDDILRASTNAGRREEVVKCKYVVGCDGAHSWTRKALGPEFETVGEMTDFIWGVLDIVPITDFPDIRNRSIIHSASSGSLMVIPRENKLVRLYIQLNEVSANGGRVDRSKITPEMILKAAQKILSPYKIEYHYCDWWTAYQIGQRVGPHFSKADRIFLAGDAVHTHSPKAGQGMNTSMQDAYNLGWKIGLVCKKILSRKILTTYEYERQMVAKQLIAFDHKFSRLFSGRPKRDILDETGVSMEEFANAFRMSHLFTTAIGINYQPSLLVAKPPGNDFDEGMPAVELRASTDVSRAQSTVSLALNCRPGTRFPSHQVLSQADARPWQLHHKMPSDGRFRIVIFAGDIADAEQRRRVNELGAWLGSDLLPRYPTMALSVGSDPHGATMKFPTDNQPSIIDVLLVHSAPRQEIELLKDLHSTYHPFDSKLGWEYDKVFVDGPSYHEGDGQAYKKYGVDPQHGAVVLVRPDGYVGLVTYVGSEGWKELEQWFAAVLRPL
ncbi:hypothetical protein VTK73DRAFT_9667 [Phialemonium thermophilum]|uniref:Phenol 2-monooxygenase n=1 Tax=Phialemonium thermophilum TaxID=223376 RepID=A0ABR3XJ28_9PEZI